LYTGPVPLQAALDSSEVSTLYGGRENDTTGSSNDTDTVCGGTGHDRIFDKSGEDKIYAGDGEQDLICVNRGSGEIVTYDPQDTFICNQSC